MTLYDIIGAAMSLSLAVLLGVMVVATFGYGAVAIVQTVGDIWRWATSDWENQRRWREEMREEWARKVAR